MTTQREGLPKVCAGVSLKAGAIGTRCCYVPISSRLSWTGEAFGLSIRSAVSLPGLVRTVRPPGPRLLTIQVGDLAPSKAAPSAHVADMRDSSGQLVVSISQLENGYLMDVLGAGIFWLTSDGTQVTCSPHAPATWLWRRYLIGQVLPFAALLQGLEVFHASGVELDGAVLALAGGSGLAKSTLALNLHLAGGRFVSDDVLAMEIDDGELVVHPGLPCAKVRRASVDLLDRRLGPPATVDGEELRFIVDGARTTLPLGVFCLLERSRDGELTVEQVTEPARRLLASSFNYVVTTPERLAAQLEICAAIGRGGRVLRVSVPEGPDPHVAARLRHLLEDSLERAADPLSHA